MEELSAPLQYVLHCDQVLQVTVKCVWGAGFLDGHLVDSEERTPVQFMVHNFKSRMIINCPADWLQEITFSFE